ncbi:histidine triad family protein [Stylonychia lemnae]|uniref:Histidine triad family protein n=1 Tax=Stylonychia lemnae TaxID=5949 RepID=A0A077ZVU1_STYLE|nr:histidine triad family protein [Stylonychia lemnae]|eukprot:CDW73365.1 histidine triad family protein [Stylonychia lemnae]
MVEKSIKTQGDVLFTSEDLDLKKTIEYKIEGVEQQLYQPDAQYHYQMISKWHIKNISKLKYNDDLDFDLVKYLKTRGLSLMKEWHPTEVQNGQIMLGFHKPMFTSQNHLHMHCIVGKKKFIAPFQFNKITTTKVDDLFQQFQKQRVKIEIKDRTNSKL